MQEKSHISWLWKWTIGQVYKVKEIMQLANAVRIWGERSGPFLFADPKWALFLKTIHSTILHLFKSKMSMTSIWFLIHSNCFSLTYLKVYWCNKIISRKQHILLKDNRWVLFWLGFSWGSWLHAIHTIFEGRGEYTILLWFHGKVDVVWRLKYEEWVFE